ncbi:MAG: hypothetical protein ACR2H5_08160 [Ktedonobacteraceae bacterium]
MERNGCYTIMSKKGTLRRLSDDARVLADCGARVVPDDRSRRNNAPA